MEDSVIDQSVASKRSSRTAPRSADEAKVLAVRHWSDRLFSFSVERPAALRFRSGEFVMLGLMGDAEGNAKPRPILRAYSIASPSWADELEFYSIKVPDGPLTSRLQHLQPGDSIILRPRPVGTLVMDALLPGNNLWLLATGTGIAPFASLIRDPEVYEKFDRIVLMHTCRQVVELEYGKALVQELLNHEFLSELAAEKFTYYPATTREQSQRQGRITNALESGSVLQELGMSPLSADSDRFMMCGSLAFNIDMQNLLETRGSSEGSNSEPGDYVIEKAFVD